MRSRPLAAQPVLRGVEQRACRLRVLVALEEAEQPPVVVLEALEVVVDLGGDAADHAPVAHREEVLGAAVLEEGVAAAVEELAALEAERRHPVRLVLVEAEGELDEGAKVPLRSTGRTSNPMEAGTLHADRH